MEGAREYASLFENGRYGKLRVLTGSHARGSYFHLYVGEEGKEVEVYGVKGGHPGWTEWYGWLHEGPWVEDFMKMVAEKREEVLRRAKKQEADVLTKQQNEKKKTQEILAAYSSQPESKV